MSSRLSVVDPLGSEDLDILGAQMNNQIQQREEHRAALSVATNVQTMMIQMQEVMGRHDQRMMEMDRKLEEEQKARREIERKHAEEMRKMERKLEEVQKAHRETEWRVDKDLDEMFDAVNSIESKLRTAERENNATSSEDSHTPHLTCDELIKSHCIQFRRLIESGSITLESSKIRVVNDHEWYPLYELFQSRFNDRKWTRLKFNKWWKSATGVDPGRNRNNLALLKGVRYHQH